MPGQHDAPFPDSALRILHLRCPADVDPQVYRLLLGLVAEVTPVVQALPRRRWSRTCPAACGTSTGTLPAWPG